MALNLLTKAELSGSTSLAATNKSLTRMNAENVDDKKGLDNQA